MISIRFFANPLYQVAKALPSEAVQQIPLKLKDVRKYGLEHGEYEGWEKQGPGQFVINEQGDIIHAKKGWIDIDSLLSVL